MDRNIAIMHILIKRKGDACTYVRYLITVGTYMALTMFTRANCSESSPGILKQKKYIDHM